MERRFELYSGSLRGFTLIELLVVISIIALLSSVVMASLNGVRAKARDARRLQDLKQVQVALDLYYDKHGSYPATDNSRNDSCATGSSNSVPQGNWSMMISALAADGFLPGEVRDPMNSGYGSASSYCYQYAGPAISNNWYRCIAPGAAESVRAGDYRYVIYYKTEGYTSNLWRMVWNDDPANHTPGGNQAYRYCILGPAK